MNENPATARFRNRLAMIRLLTAVREGRPSLWYQPHHTVTHPRAWRDVGKASGQLQFHESTHPIRVAAPGNGWGGTMALAAEVDAWCTHSQRWRKTPSHTISALWFAPEKRQFEILYQNMLQPKVFGSMVKWGTRNGVACIEWPSGDRVYVVTYDRSWQRIQGVPIDLVVFDESPPKGVWREMMQRRRGDRKTEFICKATQTVGWTWMAEDIYVPWLEHHEALGMSEDEALDAQRHPDIWCWSRGGIHDNHAADEEDILWYENQVWSSQKERRVRIWGGFESWVGNPVFDEAAMSWMDGQADKLRAKNGVGRHVEMWVRPADDLQDVYETPDFMEVWDVEIDAR